MYRERIISTLERVLIDYGLLLISLSILYIPTFMSLTDTVWKSGDQSQGPIILFLTVWLFWINKDKYAHLPPKSCYLGWLLIFFGLVSCFLGKVLDVWFFEIGSAIPLITGIVLLDRSIPGLKTLYFPILFILFLIPLPGFIVDAVTGGLKEYISKISEYALYVFDYPIARTGVTLTIGQYQLLVADACSGLNSMFSLFALGLFYLHTQNYKSKIYYIIFISAILPIAFAANIVRVIVLVLITYYFGDAAGQGFIHNAAGILLFVMALLFLYSLDVFLIKLQKLNYNEKDNQ